MLVVSPDTVLRRHRTGLLLFWKAKSRATSQEPRIAPETIALIQEMAAGNRLWGADRIRGDPFRQTRQQLDAADRTDGQERWFSVHSMVNTKG